MRLLKLVGKARVGFGCRASSTRKTVVPINGVQLYVAAGNVFCALSTFEKQYLYVRYFEHAKTSMPELTPGTPQMIRVQHGDVIVVDDSVVCPSFLEAKVDCTGLSREDCFERVKSFFHAARDKEVGFMAIVESDSPSNQKENGVLEAMKGLQVSREGPTEAGTSCKQQSKRNKKGKRTTSKLGNSKRIQQRKRKSRQSANDSNHELQQS